MIKPQPELWVSLLEVEPLDEHEYADIGGAFVIGAVLAESLASARAVFSAELTKLGFRLIVDHDTMPYRSSMAWVQSEPSLTQVKP